MTNTLIYSPSDIARFWSKVDTSGGPKSCWPWLLSLTHNGYGRFQFRGKTLRANRVSLELKLGRPLREGYQSCHNCPDGDNPSCQNPDHLWEGTVLDNVADMVAKDRHARGERNVSHIHPELRRGELNHFARLTRVHVRVIRSLYATNEFSYRELAKAFGVYKATVGKIVKFDTWK